MNAVTTIRPNRFAGVKKFFHDNGFPILIGSLFGFYIVISVWNVADWEKKNKTAPCSEFKNITLKNVPARCVSEYMGVQK